MKPKIPFTFATGDTLAPTKLNDNFLQMALDLEEVLARKYFYSSFVLDWTGLTSGAPSAEHTFLIRAPFAYEIVGVEVVLYDASTPATLTITGAGTSFEPMVLTAAGATTEVRDTSNNVVRVPANTEVSFTMDTWAGPMDKCYAVVHIRHDRAPATTYSRANAPRFAAGESVAAAKLNTAFSDYETAVAADAAATNGMRIQVVTHRPMAVALAASDADTRIPATGRILHSYDLVNHGTVGNDVTITVLDEAAATVSTTTVAGAGTGGAKTQGVSVNQEQANTDPTTVADDWKLRFSRIGASSIDLAYTVMYWA